MPKAGPKPKRKLKGAPRCLSFVVADSIRQEKNGKFLVVGAYTDVKLPKPPEPAPLAAWATILGVSAGEHSVEMRAADLTARREMRTGKQRYESSGPNMVGQVVFEMEEVSFPSSGNYHFRLLVDEAVVGEQIVEVRFPEGEAQSKRGDEEPQSATLMSQPK